MKFDKNLGGIACAVFAALGLQLAPDQARPRERTRFDLGDIAGARPIGRPVTGRARVIDGDTIEIGGRRIRLEGIDAPEIKQVCHQSDGRIWPAGRIAATTLQRWVAGRAVSCVPVGRDGYGRTLARCSVDGQDLGAGLIRSGLAWAFVKYSRTFVAEERSARDTKQGVWAANCQMAWDYRANRWGEVAEGTPGGCAIKGNITRRGRIYHMPWSPWYGRTRIEPARGERWFCNEAQALAAGWRPAEAR